MDRLSFNLTPAYLFPETPLIHFRVQRQNGACGEYLKILKTRPRTLSTLPIGNVNAREILAYCPRCKQHYFSEELSSLVPRQGKFGFDVIEKIGRDLFLQCHNDATTQQALLKEKNITLSLSEIGYLGKKFIVSLARAHQACHEQVKQYLQAKGAYILHWDGTCEGDSPHLRCSIDEISNIVLNSQKMPSENSEQIIPFLPEIKQAYGNPLALVQDMGSAILTAVKVVFPGSLDFICHYHFLKDIGKDLFEHEYNTLRRPLRTYKLSSRLRQIAKALKHDIDQAPNTLSELKRCLENKHQPFLFDDLSPVTKAYLLITWVLETRCACPGFGFPFDRMHFACYLRLQQAYPVLKKLKSQLDKGLMPLTSMSNGLTDHALFNTVERMTEKVAIFDPLRLALRIALPEQQQGLNNKGDSDIKTLAEAVTQFCQSREVKQSKNHPPCYQKMLNQIDTYRDKLFADPIKVQTPAGEITLQAQRTNHIREQFFRDEKRGLRKKRGNTSLSRTLKAMFSNTPLVKNLNHPEYMHILLANKSCLAERFADINIEQVRQEFEKEQVPLEKYP